MVKLIILSLSVFLLAWLLDSSFLPKKPPVVNFDYTAFFDPQKLRLPRSEAEIVAVVTDALRDGHKVRVLGSAHSRNSLALSDDIIISLQFYKGIIHLDKQAKLVTVKAGTTLEELAEFLDSNGLALGVMPAIMEQTLAGAISTGTHGCRSKYGNLATLVSKLKLVNGEGKVVILSSADNDTFKAAQISLGLFGVITEVTIQCESAFKLQETTEKSTMDACLLNLDQLAYSAEHVKIWLEPYSNFCDIYKFNRTSEKIHMTNVIWWIGMKMHLWEPFLLLASVLPPLAPAIIRTSVNYGKVFYPSYTQVGNSFRILTSPLYVPQRNAQIEIAVRQEDCNAAIEVVIREMEKWLPASMFTEVRFVKGDDIWLSLNYQRDSCHLTVTIYDPSAEMKEGFYNSLHHSMHGAGLMPRLHPAKYTDLSKLHTVYPKYSEFKRIVKIMDPHGMFLNEMLAGYF